MPLGTLVKHGRQTVMLEDVLPETDCENNYNCLCMHAVISSGFL